MPRPGMCMCMCVYGICVGVSAVKFGLFGSLLGVVCPVLVQALCRLGPGPGPGSVVLVLVPVLVLLLVLVPCSLPLSLPTLQRTPLPPSFFLLPGRDIAPVVSVAQQRASFSAVQQTSQGISASQ